MHRFSTVTFNNRPAYRPVIVTSIIFSVLLSITSSALFAANNSLQNALQTSQAANKASADSQKRIDALSDKTQQLYDEYKHSERQLQSLRLYNQNLQQLLASQKQEIASYDTQLAQIDDTQRDVVPLMIKMVDTLGEFIELDQPFLLDERRARVSNLKTLLNRSDITTSEKYRRIMEAYQVEMEYGRSIEAYRDEIVVDGKKLSLNFFRLGRVALYYQTLDQQKTARWDPAGKAWETLPDDFRLPIAKGLRIARKQAAPDLLLLPVAAPEQVK